MFEQGDCFLLEVNGFKVRDLGINVDTMTFIQEAEAWQADILALSALMVTTMQRQAEVIRISGKYPGDTHARRSCIRAT
ncbi:MAG: cobalamin-dependent protein [Anaerolineae bacterium]